MLWAGLPGQEIGNALADVLYGAWNPSGHLPYTIAKNASDYGAQLVLPAPGQNPSGTEPLEVNYTEGLNIDYRHFDAVRNTLPIVYVLLTLRRTTSLPVLNSGSA